MRVCVCVHVRVRECHARYIPTLPVRVTYPFPRPVHFVRNAMEVGGIIEDEVGVEEQACVVKNDKPQTKRWVGDRARISGSSSGGSGGGSGMA